MEFFAEAKLNLAVADVQRHIRLDNLAQWCDALQPVAGPDTAAATLAGPWGECRVHREVIRAGLRFSLPGHPGSIQWTLTSDLPGRPGIVLIHGTACVTGDAALASTLQGFVAAWVRGLEAGQAALQADRDARAAAASQPCVNMFH